MCSVLVDLLNQRARAANRDALATKATPDDVYAVVPTALNVGGVYFREFWLGLTAGDRQFLKRLVAGEAPQERDEPVLRKLVRKEVLKIESGAYRFQVPLVERYVEIVDI